MDKHNLYENSEVNIEINLCEPNTFADLLDYSWNSKSSFDIASELVSSPFSHWSKYEDLFALASVYSDRLYNQGKISVDSISFVEMQFISDLVCWFLLNGDIKNLPEFIDGCKTRRSL
ncbi:hypothetical protein ACTNDP_17640 [Paenibacillus barengoltzii]|uniref:hypothetical protein n=1 Tax=Paenibacillus barengoltzii TaxID=343517 RepID=UPI003F898D25